MAKIESYGTAGSPISGSDKLVGTETTNNNATKNFTVQEVSDFIRPYKVYAALLSQSGSDAPVVKILENTLGNITFAYNGIGLYDINSNELFTENKTYTVLQVWGDDQVTSRTAITTWENSSLLTLRNLSLSGDPTDGIGNDNAIAFFLTSIEIRVYND